MIITYSAIGAALLWMYVGMFPSFSEASSDFDELLESFPEGLLKAFDIQELSFNTIEKFLDMEQYGIIFPLMMIFLFVGFATSAIAREIENGTIEFILAKPISRTKIFFGRYLAGVISILIVNFFVICSVFPFALIYDVEVTSKNHIYGFFLGVLFSWAVFSLSYMLSCFFSERTKVYMSAGGVLLLMYVANIAATISEPLEKLQYLSFFHYYEHHAAFVLGEISIIPILVFSVVAIVTTIIGLVCFNKRDIAITQ